MSPAVVGQSNGRSVVECGAAGRPGGDWPGTLELESSAETKRRFLVRDLLGRGATATVFRGQDVVTGHPVAVKIAEGPTAAQAGRIHAEARVPAALDHPGIVRFIGEGTVPAGGPWAGRPFLVEEFAHGGSLADRMRSGPVGAGEAAGWAVGVLEALAHVHSRGLVHRDIKPANILLSGLRRSAVRLADFGIATTAGAPADTGESSGTVPYMSPEQAAAQPLGPSCDIYALGLVLLECLTGVKAFPGTPLESLVARTLRGPDIPDHVDRRWAQLLAAMTAMDPAAPPSAAEAADGARRLGARTGLRQQWRVPALLPQPALG